MTIPLRYDPYDPMTYDLYPYPQVSHTHTGSKGRDH